MKSRLPRRRRPSRTNPLARALRAPGSPFAKRVRRDRTRYARKPKHPAPPE